MRKDTLLRFGFATLLLGGGMGAMFAVGCGGDDNNNGNPGTTDSGPDSTSGDDASPDGNIVTGDAGSDADADAGPQNAKLLFVHASPDAPPVRLCIGFGDPSDGGSAAIQTTVPTPNNANGLPPGFGGPAGKPAVDLAMRTLTLYAIPSEAIASDVPTDSGAQKTCKDLLGPSLTDGVTADAGPPYFKLGTIPSGTLVDGSSWVFAVVGCMPGNAGGTAICGPGYDSAKGNLRVLTWRLDNTTTVGANAIGAQFIQASSPYDGVTSATLTNFTVGAGFFLPAPVSDAGADAGADAATDSGLLGLLDASVLDGAILASDSGAPPAAPQLSFIENSARFGSLAPATLASVPGVTFDGTSGFFATAVSDAGSNSNNNSVKIPLPLIQAVSWPSGTPPTAALGNGKGYAFILVGDLLAQTYVNPADGGPATADSGVFNGRSIHFLAFPTDPPVAP